MSNYSANTLATYIINKFAEMGKNISNLKLQKVLYFAQKEFIRVYDKKLFDDDIVACRHGAFVPRVNCEYSIYGVRGIDHQQLRVELLREEKTILDGIISTYEDTDAWEMVEKNQQDLENIWGYKKNIGLITKQDIKDVIKYERKETFCNLRRV